jgi:hypothetical protein
MASNISLNGTSYAGTPLTPGSVRKPDRISVAVSKIGITLVAASGKRRLVLRGTVKRTWTIEWDECREVTRAALRALHQLTTTWVLIDELGVSYTVQTEQDDLDEAYAFTDPANNLYYDMKLTAREA